MSPAAGLLVLAVLALTAGAVRLRQGRRARVWEPTSAELIRCLPREGR